MPVEINLLPHQKAALLSKKKKTLMLCGIGSGKSYLGAIWTLKKLQDSPKSMGLITANTYGQLQKATLETCFKLYDSLNIPFVYNKQLSLLTLVNEKRFLCLSAENYDTHRGIEVGEIWMDECAYYSLDAYKVFSGRLRDRHGARDILLTTTPKGMNWIYDYFHPLGEKYNSASVELITAKTRDNKYLPEDYETTLRSEYGAALSKQELDAEFVKLGSGMAYYAFSEKNLTESNLRDLNSIVYVGLDFNVNPYCAVLAYFKNNTIEVFDEVYLENSNTTAMINAIKQKIGTQLCRIIPDSTQFRRNTIGITDIEMLRNHFEVLPSHNPFVIDRVNNLNRLFEQERIFISNKCTKLINDLNKVTWKEHSLELDQVTQKMLTHMSDALGYLAYRLIPLHYKEKIVVGSYT